jgi:hypothetical protein
VKNQRGQHKRAGMLERYARYCALRDGGMLPVDAAREVGVAYGTGQNYERAWREAQGLPRRQPSPLGGAWRER